MSWDCPVKVLQKPNTLNVVSLCVSGSWVEDLRQGHGVYTYPNGDIYDGEWLHHMRYIHTSRVTEICVNFNAGLRPNFLSLVAALFFFFLSELWIYKNVISVGKTTEFLGVVWLTGMVRAFTTTMRPAQSTRAHGRMARWSPLGSSSTPTTDIRVTLSTIMWVWILFLRMQSQWLMTIFNVYSCGLVTGASINQKILIYGGSDQS